MKLSYQSARIILYNKYLNCLFYSCLSLFMILFHSYLANKNSCYIIPSNCPRLISLWICIIFIYNVPQTIPRHVEGIFKWQFIYAYHIWDPVWDIFLVVGFVRVIHIFLCQIRTYLLDSREIYIWDLILGEPIFQNVVFYGFIRWSSSNISFTHFDSITVRKSLSLSLSLSLYIYIYIINI